MLTMYTNINIRIVDMDIITLRSLIVLKIKMSTALISHLYRGKLLQHIPFLELSLIRKAKNISSSKHTKSLEVCIFGSI